MTVGSGERRNRCWALRRIDLNLNVEGSFLILCMALNDCSRRIRHGKETARMSDYERQRLQTLRQFKLLDTSPSEGFDRITRTARKLFGLPLSAVSLTDEDRQWFKSRMGIKVTEVPRHKSPCSDVSASSEVVVIEDLLASDFYCDSPQARLGMRFYAGAPPYNSRWIYTWHTLRSGAGAPDCVA